jgi:hypothetical protein
MVRMMDEARSWVGPSLPVEMSASRNAALKFPSHMGSVRHADGTARDIAMLRILLEPSRHGKRTILDQTSQLELNGIQISVHVFATTDFLVRFLPVSGTSSSHGKGDLISISD